MFKVILIKQAAKEFKSLSPTLRAATADVMKALQDYGNELREPHVKSLGKGLKELRATARDGISRSFFFFTQGKKAYVVHIMQKKTSKTPQQTLDLAYARMKQLQQELDNDK